MTPRRAARVLQLSSPIIAAMAASFLLTGCAASARQPVDVAAAAGKGSAPAANSKKWKRPVPPAKGTLHVLIVDETASFRAQWKDAVDFAASWVHQMRSKDAIMVIGADVHSWDDDDVRIPRTTLPRKSLQVIGFKRDLVRKIRELTQRDTSSGSETGYRIAMAELKKRTAERKAARALEEKQRARKGVKGAKQDAKRRPEEPETDRLGTDLLGAIDFAAYLASKSAEGRTVDLQVFSDFEEEPGRQPEHTPVAFPHDSRMRALFVSTGGKNGGGNAYTARLQRWSDKLGVYVSCTPQDFSTPSEVQGTR
jgi:hypothetical protein